MAAAGTTRRAFLRWGLAGGATLATAPLWLQRLARAGDLDALTRQAPVARYWVSTAAPAGKCASCHAPAELGGRKTHAHETRTVRCLPPTPPPPENDLDKIGIAALPTAIPHHHLSPSFP